MPINSSIEVNGIIYFVAFVAIFLFCIGIAQFMRHRAMRRDTVQKIKNLGEEDLDSTITPAEDTGAQKRQSVFSRLFGKIGSLGKADHSIDYSAKRLRFLRAGIRQENAAVAFWGAKLFFGALLLLVFFFVRFAVFKVMNYQLTMVLAILISLVGFYLPDLWLRQRVDTRKGKILKALPDALDLLVICVEAGMGLDSAINRVAKETRFTSPELSEELSQMSMEMRAGKQRQDALKNLGLRTDLDEIKSLTTLLIQTDKFGTSMASALRVYSDSYRTERMQKAEEVAAKLPVKLIFPMAFFIFPSLFLVILGPAFITIYQNIIKRIAE
jgi:tight adherence protein C